MGAKILLVEDELHIAKLIIHHANKDGYSVDHVTRGDEAISNYSSKDYDLVILDLMLPGLDGLEVCRKLREKSNRAIPIIMLTAKDEEIDKIVGLEIGADDYMTKPFSPRELMARVKAQLRIREDVDKQKSTKDQQDLININIDGCDSSLQIDTSKYRVFFGSEVLDLTRKEFELLKLLASNSGQVLTREMLLERIWGYDYIGDTRTVDVHIRYLRQKLKQINCSTDLIETVRGVGYRLKEME